MTELSQVNSQDAQLVNPEMKNTVTGAQAMNGPIQAGSAEEPSVSPTVEPSVPTSSTPAGSKIRLLAATLITGAVSVPIGTLLSYGAALPSFIGLFFFALFGLMIGAVMFRISKPARPYGRSVVITCTAIVLCICVGTSLIKEAIDFPQDMASQAIQKTKNLGGKSPEEFRQQVKTEVQTALNNQFGSSGPIGYFPWIITDGKFEKGSLPTVEYTLRSNTTRVLWVVRVLLSTLLLGFGVFSQTLALTKPQGGTK